MLTTVDGMGTMDEVAAAIDEHLARGNRGVRKAGRSS